MDTSDATVVPTAVTGAVPSITARVVDGGGAAVGGTTGLGAGRAGDEGDATSGTVTGF